MTTASSCVDTPGVLLLGGKSNILVQNTPEVTPKWHIFSRLGLIQKLGTDYIHDWQIVL